MSIVACYVASNEAGLLVDSIRSVKAYIDKIVVIDAVFTRNPINATHSTDDSMARALAIADAEPRREIVYVESSIKLTEAQARSCYLNYLLAGVDWGFIIDSDEMLYGDYTKTMGLFAGLRTQKPGSPHAPVAFDMAVFTTAPLTHKSAPETEPFEYQTAPIISYYGSMPRIFGATSDVAYAEAKFGVTPFLISRSSGRPIKGDHLIDPKGAFLVNHHTRQSLESYRNDYEWEKML